MGFERVDKLVDYQNPLYRVDLSGLNMISMFEEMVRWLPDETALLDGEIALTYAQVNQRSNQIGRTLLAHSPAPGETVAALADTGPEMALMNVGVMKARKVLVGLLPSHPVLRLEELITDAEARVILCCTATLTLASELADRLDLTLLNINALDEEDHSNLALPYDPQDLVAVIYTSGSTGKPKGVMKSHQSSLHGLGTHAAMGLDASMRHLSIYHFSYANGVLAPFKAWLLGGTYHPFDLNRYGLPAMIEKLKQEQITVYQSPPSLFRNLVRQIAPGELSSVRWVHLGGEPVLARDFEMFKEKFHPPCLFFNNYGSSEVGSMARNLMDHDSVVEGEVIPLGYSSDRMSLTIVDENGEPVKQGEIGEMVVRSKYIVPGYWKDPELTARKIHQIEGSDERRIHTGDLVYQLPDGRYVYAGRKDSMVKVRGSRVYTAEVEAALGRMTDVDEAVVRVINTPAGDARLIAYLQPKAGAVLKNDRIRRALATRLPGHMIPGQFVFVEDFPRTISGKIDRQRLPDPERSRPDLSHPVEPAQGEMETRLVLIWERVLDLTGIGVTDNFFDLGGDSLLAVELFIEIEKTFGQNLPISLLLEAGTIRQQAEMLKTVGDRDTWQPLVAFSPEGRQIPLFCFAGKGGNPIRFRQLASGLGADQPVYFLQSRGLSGMEAPLASIEEIAADFIKAIRQVAPRGPYRLLGSSFGGKVAYEVACQLMQAGEQVAFVMMLDTFAPGYPQYLKRRPRLVEKLRDYWEYLSKHWHSLRVGSAEDRRAYLGYYFDLVPLYLARWRQKRRPEREARQRARLLPAAYQKVEAANVRASRLFVPAPFPGCVILVRASQQPPGIVPDPTLGWGKFDIETLEIHQVDGHHGNLLMPPQVNQVAEILKPMLKRNHIPNDLG
jgi:amino acid adenylation domain-containing protein